MGDGQTRLPPILLSETFLYDSKPLAYSSTFNRAKQGVFSSPTASHLHVNACLWLVIGQSCFCRNVDTAGYSKTRWIFAPSRINFSSIRS